MVSELGCVVLPRDTTIVTEPSLLGAAVKPLTELRASVTPGTAMNWFQITMFQNLQFGGR